MERFPNRIDTVADLTRDRDQLAEQVAGRMERASAVFLLAASFNPSGIQRIHHAEMPLVLPSGRDAAGREILTISPAVESPLSYRLPYIVLPARNFIDPFSRKVVSRSAVAQLAIEYETPHSNGVYDELPIDIPTPDRAELSISPMMLGVARFDQPHPAINVQTVSGDFVRIYDSSEKLQTQAEPDYCYYPYKSSDEALDWAALQAYPPESLNRRKLTMHAENGLHFDAQLEVINSALQDESLNPRP